MISSTIKLKPRLIGPFCRFMSIPNQGPTFKFKLTDEAIKKFEEDQAKKPKKPEPEQALYTRQSSLIMGRISHEREQDSVQALDEEEQCKPGDWVLLRRQEKPLDKGVEHKVEKVVYEYGNYIDPLTNRRSFGLYYDDDYQKLEKIKMDF